MFLQSWKVPLGSLDASIFLLTTFLLLFRSCCAGPLQVVGSSQPVVAMMGDDITLPCLLKPSVDAVAMALEWTRPGLRPRFVYRRRDNQELLLNQNPSYAGRTSMSRERLKLGDASLKLSNVKMSDEGNYRCFFPTEVKDSFIQLLVGSASSPVIRLSGIDKSSGAVMLECKSAGWYPEPEVLWLDAEGHLVSAGPTETLRGPDGLYTVSSSVTVEHKHNNTFTCKLQQNKTNQTRETQIQVPDDFFTACPSGAWRIAVSLAACFVFILTAVVVVWKWSPNKTKMKLKDEREERYDHQSREDQSLVTREQNVTGNQRNERLNTENEKRKEEFETTEEELTYVNEVIQTLRAHKEDLTKQRAQIISLLQEVNAEIKENKNNKRKDKKQNARGVIETNLEKRKKEQEEVLASSEKILKTTEAMINKMNVKKGKLEQQKKQLKPREKKTGKPREEEKPEQWTSIPITE